MFNNFTVWLTNYALKRSDLTVEQRNSVVLNLLENLDALPFVDVIDTDDEGNMVINGKILDVDGAIRLKENAISALENGALKVARDHVAFQAVALGVHKVESPLQMLFGRVAIWYHQQLTEQLKYLAQR